MRVEEIEAEAMRLPEPERVRLAERLLASVPAEAPDDPIFGLGSSPVSSGAPDGSREHDRYVYPGT